MPFTVRDASGRIAGWTRFVRIVERHNRLEIGGARTNGRVYGSISIA